MGKLSFGTTGLSYQVDEVKVKTSGAPNCPRCNQRVYFMEQMLANGKSWHKKCYNCVSCKKPLDSTNCCAHEEEIYCKMCHKREFGPKGYGFAGGAAGLSTDSASGKRSTKTSPPRSAVFTHPAHIPASNGTDRQGRDYCPRCDKRVYQAEEVKANGRSWHRLCFKCAECNKMLERGRTNEHEGELYCQGCYNRNYGIRGYGFAGGNGSLLSATKTPPKVTNGAAKVNGSPNGGSSRGVSPAHSSSLEGSPRSTSPTSYGEQGME